MRRGTVIVFSLLMSLIPDHVGSRALSLPYMSVSKLSAKELGTLYDPRLGDKDNRQPFVMHLRQSKWPRHYSRLDELYAWIADYDRLYPDLIQVYDIGDSFCKQRGSCQTPGGDSIRGRDILSVRITNEKAKFSKKGRLWIDGGLHARELPAMALVKAFIRYLVEGYGKDAQVTYLLNHRELYAGLCSNPDGRLLVELGTGQPYNGNPWSWRKNADYSPGSYLWPPVNGSTYGVDLNRNHAFKWGLLPGSSSNPLAETFRGAGPASEPETRAYEGFVSSLFPDQRGAADSDAAPKGTTGLLINFHSRMSYPGAVLVPWGWTKALPPNYEDLVEIAKRYAAFTGYDVRNAFYPVSGSTRDWGYGTLGIPSYTIELPGTRFFAPSEELAAVLSSNMSPLLFMLGISDRPYLRIHGPEITSVQMPGVVDAGERVTILAHLDDSRSGGQAIAGATVLIGRLDGANIDAPLPDPEMSTGQGSAMTAVDGMFNEKIEDGMFEIDTSRLTRGRYSVVIRGRDADGFWGPGMAKFLEIQAPCQPNARTNVINEVKDR